LRMVLGHSARLAIPGTLIGVILALSLSRVVRGLVYQVSPTDPVVMTAVVLLVLFIALLASYIPARRAAATDPMTTLRTE
jgi:putative ABC transport system permease protein